jgi:hypothetical protein
MKDNFFALTKQQWKIRLIPVSILIAWALMEFADYWSQMIGLDSSIFLGVTGLGEIFLVIWVFVSTRCPNCHTRVLWWVVKHVKLSQLSSLTVCPLCKYGVNAKSGIGS